MFFIMSYFNCVNLFCVPVVEEAFNWLVRWLLQATQEKVDTLTEDTDRFTARNHSQVFYAHTLSLAFAQVTDYLFPKVFRCETASDAIFLLEHFLDEII